MYLTQIQRLTSRVARELSALHHPCTEVESATRKNARTLDSVALWRAGLSSNEMIILAVVIAVLLRIAVLSAAHAHGLVIDSEGAEYARIAQNLRFGHGYVGVFNNGPELNDAPLFPLLIAALSFILLGTEIAARVISYIAEKKPDFIVLLQDSRRSTPYLAQWFDKGIPDRRAELIYDKGDSGRERVEIYRWDNRSAREYAK